MNYKVKNDKLIDYILYTSLQDFLCENHNLKTKEDIVDFVNNNIKDIHLLRYYGDFDNEFEYAILLKWVDGSAEIYDYITYESVINKYNNGLLEVI